VCVSLSLPLSPSLSSFSLSDAMGPAGECAADTNGDEFIASELGASVVSGFICIWRRKATEQVCMENCLEKYQRGWEMGSCVMRFWCMYIYPIVTFVSGVGLIVFALAAWPSSAYYDGCGGEF
jgi:hypothetical protein